MAAPALPAMADSRKSLGHVAAFALHTLVVYACALRLSGWLVYHWFGWVAPILQISINIPATDWYLQHFELMTIIPALVVGCINVVRLLPTRARNYMLEGRGSSISTWVWIIPTMVLLYRMLEYHAPFSVLSSGSMTAIKYFFDIQTVMPTLANLLASDPVRLWAQMSVTGPFYAGVAYSLGALASKHELLKKLFTFEKVEE